MKNYVGDVDFNENAKTEQAYCFLLSGNRRMKDVGSGFGVSLWEELEKRNLSKNRGISTGILNREPI